MSVRASIVAFAICAATACGVAVARADGPGPHCGNGRVEAWEGESCDDGNRVAFDACDNTCQPTTGIYLSQTEILSLPTYGAAWNALFEDANEPVLRPDLARQDDPVALTNVYTLARALVYVRTGLPRYRAEVVAILDAIVRDLRISDPPVPGEGTRYDGRALSLGRELGAYAIAADLVDLATFDPALDAQFRTVIRDLLTTYTHPGPQSLVECHERRPNNWGTHCGGARVAVAAYLGDRAELARAHDVLLGYLGDRSRHAGFDFDVDLSWQCDPARPVAINPFGCQVRGHPFGGVLPEEMRRSGRYAGAWPPPRQNYAWEALQGVLLQTLILERAGYPVWREQTFAIARAAVWLEYLAGYPADGDDAWQSWILNAFVGSPIFTAVEGTRPGKNLGYTDWTHQ